LSGTVKIPHSRNSKNIPHCWGQLKYHTVGTAKTVLYEVSDNTNQAVGMFILSMSWGAGLILGPTFGGLYIKGKFTRFYFS
jgi:hypothetical protein